MSVLATAEKLVTKCNAMGLFWRRARYVTYIHDAVSANKLIKASNEEFLQAALSFPKDCFLAAEILRLLPNPVGS